MIADLIIKIAAMEAEEETFPYHPRPSLAGPMHREGIESRCIRSMVYWAGNFEAAPFPGRGQIIFSDSSFHEDLTFDWLRKSIYKVHSEQMEINVDGRKGKIDCLITDPLGKDYLIEHKAINHFSFQNIWNGEIPWDYIHQCCDYFNGLQDINPEIQEGIILFKNKNTAQYIELWLSYYKPIDQCEIVRMIRSTGEEIKISKVIEWPIVAESSLKFQTVADYVSRKEFPKRPYPMNHWRCEYCRWGAICWENYDAEFEALEDKAELEGEIVDLARYYLETNGHLNEIEAEKEKLRSQIIKILEDKQIRKGSAGLYNIHWQLIPSEKLDQSLIPAEILLAAKKKSHYYKLNIRKRKEK